MDRSDKMNQNKTLNPLPSSPSSHHDARITTQTHRSPRYGQSRLDPSYRRAGGSPQLKPTGSPSNGRSTPAT